MFRKVPHSREGKSFRTTQPAVLKTNSNWALIVPTIKNYAYKSSIPPHTLQTEMSRKSKCSGDLLLEVEGERKEGWFSSGHLVLD